MMKPYPTQPMAPVLPITPETAHSPGNAINPNPGMMPRDTPLKPKLGPDSSKFDIVKATQYGAEERVKELVEAGYDVLEPDKENVTLLHWAAINNRLDLVK